MTFIFILVDQGCFFIQEQKGKILSKSFYPTLEFFQDRDLLQQNPRVSLHVFFDTLHQTYTRKKFPPMQWWVLKKILAHHSHTKDSESHWMREDKNTYLFVDLILSKEQKAWLGFIETLPNPIAPPRLIPLEITAGVQEKVCTVLIYQEEHIGLRQVVVHEGRFLLTRLIPSPLFNDCVAETTHLLRYLKTTYGIEDVNIAPLESYFEKVVCMIDQPPILSLRLKLWALYYREESLRKILLTLSFLCIMVLMIGSFYLDDQKHKQEQALVKATHDLEILEAQLQMNPVAEGAEEAAKKAALWSHYETLKRGMIDPLKILEKIALWLADQWQVTHIGWHKDAEETLEVGLEYLGPRHKSKDALKEQATKPFALYTISILKDPGGLDVLRFTRAT